CAWTAVARQAAVAVLNSRTAGVTTGTTTGGRNSGPETGRGSTGSEPGMLGVIARILEIDGRIDGSELPNIPTRMEGPWAWRVRRAFLPLTAPVWASDRV